MSTFLCIIYVINIIVTQQSAKTKKKDKQCNNIKNTKKCRNLVTVKIISTVLKSLIRKNSNYTWLTPQSHTQTNNTCLWPFWGILCKPVPQNVHRSAVTSHF